MLINSPFAERTSARASTSSVSRADNCLYSKSCAVPPAMNHRFRQARLGFVFTSEIASTHRSPQPPLLNGITPAVKSLGGIRLPSQTKSYFILRLPSQNLAYKPGRQSTEKIMQGGKKIYIVCEFADVCHSDNHVRRATVYKMRLSRCCSVVCPHIINVEIKPIASVIVAQDFTLGCIKTLSNKGEFNRLLCQSGAEG